MFDVVIVGGGPVGLYLATLLLQNGLSVRILEQRFHRNSHSRAIGIHPPALDALDRAGIASTLITDGVQIRRGLAMSGGRRIAEMSFESVSARFPFVLSVPQAHTEFVLERRVQELDAEAMLRGTQVTDLHDDGGQVTFDVASGGYHRQISGTLAVAADGTRSKVRGLLGIPSTVKTYPDHYLMGDFSESSGHGHDAALFLETGGIVESFPLPGGVRRWVARLRGPLEVPTAFQLAALVRERTGINVDAGTNTMLSSFGAGSSIARRMVVGRTAIIGDAAHAISPIGGQGMNLGWLDAAALAPLLIGALNGVPMGQKLHGFERRRRRAATTAVRQSELNMALGRPLPQRLLTARNRMISGVTSMPTANALVARRFTMQ